MLRSVRGVLRGPEPDEPDRVGCVLDLDDDGEIERQFGGLDTPKNADEPRALVELDDEDRVRRGECGVDDTMRDGPRDHAAAALRRFPRDVERSAVRATVSRWMPPRSTGPA